MTGCSKRSCRLKPFHETWHFVDFFNLNYGGGHQSVGRKHSSTCSRCACVSTGVTCVSDFVMTMNSACSLRVDEMTNFSVACVDLPVLSLLLKWHCLLPRQKMRDDLGGLWTELDSYMHLNAERILHGVVRGYLPLSYFFRWWLVHWVCVYIANSSEVCRASVAGFLVNQCWIFYSIHPRGRLRQRAISRPFSLA